MNIRTFGLCALFSITIFFEQSAQAERGDEVIVVIGELPCKDEPNTHGVEVNEEDVLCVCNVGFAPALGGGCKEVSTPTLGEIFGDICEVVGCGGSGGVPDPPSMCELEDDAGLTCAEGNQLCKEKSDSTLAHCRKDLNDWANHQCKNHHFPASWDGLGTFHNMCTTVMGSLSGTEMTDFSDTACFGGCTDGWKQEGSTSIKVNVGTGAVSIGGSIGGSEPGVARVSSCNEAGLAVWRACRDDLRNSGCPEECLDEPPSGVPFTISPYRTRASLPEGKPALAMAILAHRISMAEHMINDLGYRLLDEKRTNDAIILFRWNVESFPNSANAYDSLAEAYLSAGDVVSSIRNYERALFFDSSKASARRALDELERQGQYRRDRHRNNY